jgi:hypothetical protein
LRYRGLHAPVRGELIIFISNILKYNNTDETSGPGNSKLNIFINVILEYFSTKRLLAGEGRLEGITKTVDTERCLLCPGKQDVKRLFFELSANYKIGKRISK